MKFDEKSSQKLKSETSLKPADFTDLFKSIPSDWVLVGGQAVAIWAARYKLNEAVTSKDIDFWGTATNLRALAKKLQTQVHAPHEYDRTWLIGAVRIIAGGQKTTIELLRQVPGLDNQNITNVAIPIPVDNEGTEIPVLTPVSLVLTKLYALRHFDQTERNDLEHLKIAIKASRAFIAEAIKQNTNCAHWNCNRVITVHRDKKHQELQQKHGFTLLDALPIEMMEECAKRQELPDWQKLENFLNLQWPRIKQ